MTITKKQEGASLSIALEGRLDIHTAPQPEAERKSSPGGVTERTLDFEKLVCLSSAGLRTMLSAQKQITARDA